MQERRDVSAVVYRPGGNEEDAIIGDVIGGTQLAANNDISALIGDHFAGVADQNLRWTEIVGGIGRMG
ncbi:MAG: hypothetical protein P8Y78_14625, partial [Acidihalobacter sp.]